ncbi:MAG: bifunctional (p)ppGpp synthetase/guanosine-3',5'-bis(diphosphate) 3'-pyrophosphohydrolase, partial [Zoogloeaceae bacterium]|nr:bifunctional (p)ppGpp synthetase/guanosine-3',5'-bis(diphosphate) 3'-pyrophosphohydrolase [Zoogloeaceae bacterium]
MVSVTHAISSNDAAPPLELISEGLDATERKQVEEALALAEEAYEGHVLGTGESALTHALGMALIAASLKLDAETRIAGLLFSVCEYQDDAADIIARRFSPAVGEIIAGLRRLNGLRLLTRKTARASAPEIRAQTEVLRKMLLGMVQDIRVVLLRLASRTQTLRFFTEEPPATLLEIARESLDLYAPLANRLGVWQLKWELEDLSFRFLEPDTYKRIAKMLDERRSEREEFIQKAIERLKSELTAAGVKADVYGRPKHIFSIFNKMRSKGLDFSQVYDIRAVRILVDKVQECYTALDIVNRLWQPIAKEYDDYIIRPKGNNYQSLHTAVRASDGRALEVQIRTHDMHRHAELGVAAHWRYKEGSTHGGDYDEKIALLRSLLSWRDEVADTADWVEQFRRAALDDTIYVLTPQGQVIDLPRGATPIDFAYRLHTDLGHHCRGAKVDGHLVTLNTPLDNGQTVEISTVREGGPSRDWLNSSQAYVTTSRARNKIKQYFSALEEEDLLARGRAFVTREMQREGHGQANIDNLAEKLGFKSADVMFVAAGRGEVGPRAVQVALRDPNADDGAAAEPEVVVGRSRTGDTGGKVLIKGVGMLLTSLSRCCKPAPPDAIQGFVTRGRGVSVHRVDCPDFQRIAIANPERVVDCEWNGEVVEGRHSLFPVDIEVSAIDRQGLLRDISEVLSREKLNVIAVNTLTKKGRARMRFTMEVGGISQVQRALALVREVRDVVDVRRK